MAKQESLIALVLVTGKCLDRKFLSLTSIHSLPFCLSTAQPRAIVTSSLSESSGYLWGVSMTSWPFCLYWLLFGIVWSLPSYGSILSQLRNTTLLNFLLSVDTHFSLSFAGSYSCTLHILGLLSVLPQASVLPEQSHLWAWPATLGITDSQTEEAVRSHLPGREAFSFFFFF